MGAKKKRTKLWVSLLALVLVLVYSLLGNAGNLQPSGPPGPTMKTLDEIYDAVVEGLSGISEREGYIQNCEVAGNSNETLFTVPAGKQFVLMKLYFQRDSLSLTVNDNTFISGLDFAYTINTGGLNGTHVDFPDRCVTVNDGETLKVVNDEIYSRRATIVGYFCDVP